MSLLFLTVDAALIVILTATIFGRRYVLAAGVIAVCYPAFLLTAGQTDSHIFGLFWTLTLTLTLALCAWRAARGRHPGWAVAAGVALGRMAALTRPAMGPLGLLVPLAVLLERPGAIRQEWLTLLRPGFFTSALAFCSMAIVLAPVIYHNHEQKAGWVISTNNQRNVV